MNQFSIGKMALLIAHHQLPEVLLDGWEGADSATLVGDATRFPRAWKRRLPLIIMSLIAVVSIGVVWSGASIPMAWGVLVGIIFGVFVFLSFCGIVDSRGVGLFHFLIICATLIAPIVAVCLGVPFDLTCGIFMGIIFDACLGFLVSLFFANMIRGFTLCEFRDHFLRLAKKLECSPADLVAMTNEEVKKLAMERMAKKAGELDTKQETRAFVHGWGPLFQSLKTVD